MRRNRKPVTLQPPSSVPSQGFGFQNESWHRGKLGRETFRRQYCPPCASPHVTQVRDRCPAPISSDEMRLQCGETTTWLSSCVPQNGTDPFNKLFEALFRFLQLFLAGGGQPVELCLSICVRYFPLRADPTTQLHAVQRGIEGPLLHGEELIGGFLDMLHNSVTVHLTFLGEGFQHQEVEASLQIISGHSSVPLDNLVQHQE